MEIQYPRRVLGPLLPILLLLLLTASPGCDRKTVPRSSGAADFEQQVFSGINEYRRGQGLPALAWNDAVAEQARTHSRDMASGKVQFGHEGVNQRFDNIRKQLRVNALAENVALNKGYRNPARDAVTGWIGSPPHRENIIGNYSMTGVGAAVSSDGTWYFTQIFVR